MSLRITADLAFSDCLCICLGSHCRRIDFLGVSTVLKLNADWPQDKSFGLYMQLKLSSERLKQV